MTTGLLLGRLTETALLALDRAKLQLVEPFFQPLKALVVRLELEGKVHFLGHCDRVAELLAVSDVCVLSSTAEGFSNAILEYMAAARPVVATDVGGAREAVVEGATGYLVPAGDDERMAARILSLPR